MTVGAFVAVMLAGAGVVLLGRRATRLAAPVEIAALAVALLATLAVAPGSEQPVGGMTFLASGYLRLALVAAAAIFLVLAVQSLASGEVPGVGDAFLVTLAAFAAGLGALDGRTLQAAAVPVAAGPALAILAAGGAGLLLASAGLRGAGGLPDPTVLRTANRLLRLVGLATALALAGMAWLAGPSGIVVTDPVAVAAALLLVAAAVAVRIGALPFHAVMARLVAAGGLPGVVALAAWLPALFALAATTWSNAMFGGFGAQAPPEARAVVVLVAVATLAMGTTAAVLADEIPRVVAYAIVADWGFALLAMVSIGPDGLAAARTWLLCNALAKSGLIGWTMAMDGTFGSTRLVDLHGWARRAPGTAAALAMVAVATYGLPGWPGFDSRAILLRDASGGLLQALGLASAWIGIAVYARLLVIGLVPADGLSGAAIRLQLPAPPAEPAGSVRRQLFATAAGARGTWRLRQQSVNVASAVLAALLALGISAGVGGLAAAARDVTGPRGQVPAAGPSPAPAASTAPLATPRPSAGPGASPRASGASGASVLPG